MTKRNAGQLDVAIFWKDYQMWRSFHFYSNMYMYLLVVHIVSITIGFCVTFLCKLQFKRTFLRFNILTNKYHVVNVSGNYVSHLKLQYSGYSKMAAMVISKKRGRTYYSVVLDQDTKVCKRSFDDISKTVWYN